MLPEYPEFRSLEIKDLDKVKAHLKRAHQQICEWAPANLLIWKDFDHPLLTTINQNLCAYISPPNEPPYFLEPVGGHKIPETIAICLKHAGKSSRISEDFIFRLDLDKYKITCLRNQFDYTYERKALVELKGRKYDGKRNHIKRFRGRFAGYQFVALDKSLRESALALFEEWFDRKKESRHFPKLAYTAQRSALERAFQYYEELGLAGGALIIEGRLKGFIIGSALNPQTASVHFQYTDPSLRGISQALLQEACERTFAPFKYVNLEQDLGIPGLRKAKLSYYPLRLEKKFELLPIPA